MSHFFSIREVTNLDWVGMIVTGVAARIIQLMIAAVASGTLAIFGIGAAMLLNGGKKKG